MGKKRSEFRPDYPLLGHLVSFIVTFDRFDRTCLVDPLSLRNIFSMILHF